MNYRKIHLFIFVCLILTSLVMGMEQLSNCQLDFYNEYSMRNKKKPLNSQAIIKKTDDGRVIIADIVISCYMRKQRVKTSLVILVSAPNNDSKATPDIEHYFSTHEKTILMCSGIPYIKNDYVFYQVAALKHIEEYGFKLSSEKLQYKHPLFLNIGKNNSYINLIEFISLPFVLQAILDQKNERTLTIMENREAKIINWANVTLPSNYEKFKAHPWSPHYQATSFKNMPEDIKFLCNIKYVDQQYKLFLEKVNNTVGHASY